MKSFVIKSEEIFLVPPNSDLNEKNWRISKDGSEYWSEQSSLGMS